MCRILERGVGFSRFARVLPGPGGQHSRGWRGQGRGSSIVLTRGVRGTVGERAESQTLSGIRQFGAAAGHSAHKNLTLLRREDPFFSLASWFFSAGRAQKHDASEENGFSRRKSVVCLRAAWPAAALSCRILESVCLFRGSRHSPRGPLANTHEDGGARARNPR